MGNIQVLNGFYPSSDPVNAEASPSGSEIFDFNDDINSAGPSSSSDDNKLICEYCQEYCFRQFHEQHVRICSCNPRNIQGSDWFQSQRNNQLNTNSELRKTPCEYCNEPCYLKYKDDHQRICPKNPENIKINCRYCLKTFNLITYQNHLDSCEDTHHQRRRSVNSTSASERSIHIFPTNIRRSKTNNDITFERHEQRNSVRPIIKKEEHECPICLEGIKSNFDLKNLPCNHKFHKHCITHWSCVQRKCPICRQEFPY